MRPARTKVRSKEYASASALHQLDSRTGVHGTETGSIGGGACVIHEQVARGHF